MDLRALFAGFLAMVMAHAATAADQVRFYYFADDEPLSWQDGDGHARGRLIDTLDLVAHKAGIQFDYHTVPWLRAQMMIQHGQLDAFLTVPNEARRNYALFVPTPVIETVQLIYHRVDDRRFDHVRSPADLVGLAQLTLLGGGTGEIFDPRNNITVHSQEDMLHVIVAGRADYFISDPLFMASPFSRTALSHQVVGSAAPFLKRLNFRIGLRKNFPHAEAVARKLDEAVRMARKSGEIDRTLKGKD